MRDIILYIASSKDGFIAKTDGNIDWLHNIPHEQNNDYGYAAFFDSIGTTLIGGSTYRQILSFDVPFPYTGKVNYVFSRKDSGKTKNVEFINTEIVNFVENLKSGSGKDIWLVGGSEINTYFAEHHLIDKIMHFEMPVEIGEGIPVFRKMILWDNFQEFSQKEYPNKVIETHFILKKKGNL